VSPHQCQDSRGARIIAGLKGSRDTGYSQRERSRGVDVQETPHRGITQVCSREVWSFDRSDRACEVQGRARTNLANPNAVDHIAACDVRGYRTAIPTQERPQHAQTLIDPSAYEELFHR
jgi:hypothetical protein